jgi:flagellin-specific chaperone FliS
MLTDLLGFYRRNLKRMNNGQIKKELDEIKKIEQLLKDKLERVV